MSIESIAIALIIIALVWTNLRLSGKTAVLEYRLLLVTEVLAEMEGSEDSKRVAKQTRDEINKKHWFLDKIVQNS